MKTTTRKKPKTKSIVIVGRRWFEKTNGNTYHSAELYVNGSLVHKIDYAYGYGSQFEWNARRWLDEQGYLPGIENRLGTPGESLWTYCDRHKIAYTCTVTDVARKRDL